MQVEVIRHDDGSDDSDGLEEAREHLGRLRVGRDELVAEAGHHDPDQEREEGRGR